MPIASPEVYAEMLDRAKAGGFAYPAINVTSSQTLNAALQGFAEAESDGIIQVSTGGAEYLSGPTVKDMVTGAVALRRVRARGGQELPGQHRPAHRPLPEGQAGRLRPPAAGHLQGAGRQRGEEPLFQSHMWDGSAVPVEENLQIAEELLAQAAAAKIVLEIEVGVVGGEEDGVENAINDKLYTTVEDGLATVEALGLGEKGRYMAALTFGNVHGVYKPGNVKLRPEILKEIQDAVGAKYGKEKPLDLVFHGGSGSLLSGDPRGARLRRGEDEHRHRHPVRLHPPGRGPHVPQLRRRAEGRRRGRQQEAVRPARLGQGRRGRPGRPRRRGLRAPALHRHHADQVTDVTTDGRLSLTGSRPSSSSGRSAGQHDRLADVVGEVDRSRTGRRTGTAASSGRSSASTGSSRVQYSRSRKTYAPLAPSVP